MPYAGGILLALLTGLLTKVARFDRDRAVYPTLLIVIASYYVLFAVMGGSHPALNIESVILIGFLLAAMFGFIRNLWWVVAALAGHGVLDFVHGRLVANPGVPAWWPAFCLSFDLALAAWLAWRLRAGSIASRR